MDRTTVQASGDARQESSIMAAVPGRERTEMVGPLGLHGPPDPIRPAHRIEPFRAVLTPPAALVLPADEVGQLDLAETQWRMHPDLPEVPAWGFSAGDEITSPGPLLEVRADQQAIIR
jgi:hypothetical protein